MSSYQLNSKYNFEVLLFVELAVAERDSKSASVSFSFCFRRSFQKRVPGVPSGDRGNWGQESSRPSLYANESRDEHAVYFWR